MKKALIVFAKAPVAGTVKTRLQVDIGAEKTVEIYKSFVAGILDTCSRMKETDRFLGCAPSRDDDFLSGLAERYDMRTFNQSGDSLGSRIFNAFRYCSRKGYEEIVLIGSDSPSIPADFIKKAFLELKKKDLVIGPCFDRGLYLIGARREKINRIFRSIELDTGEDVNRILDKVNDINISLSLLPFWYDIDNVNDLKFLKLHMKYLGIKAP